MMPSTLVPASPAPKMPPLTTADGLIIPEKHRVTLNLSVRDARNFSYLLRDIQVFNGPRGDALNAVRRKLAQQLHRCPEPATVRY